MSIYNWGCFWGWFSEDRVTISPTRTVHVQFQKDFMCFVLLSFLKIHVPFRHANHQSSNPSVASHQDMTKLNTYAQQHSVKQAFHSSLFICLLTKWTLLGWDSFLIISVCVALLSSPFRDAGLLGEFTSLCEVAGLLPAGGLGTFAFIETSLFSLWETSWRVKHQNHILYKCLTFLSLHV